MYMCVEQTYLTGSPQWENIAGCGTHSQQGFGPGTPPGEDDRSNVIQSRTIIMITIAIL